MPPQGRFPAVKEAEMAQLSPWQPLTQAGTRCRHAFLQQLSFVERIDCTWRWFCKIAIEPRYLACWVPVLESCQKFEESYQLPCFMLQQFLSAFSCLYAETLGCAQQLKFMGLSGHYSFSYIRMSQSTNTPLFTGKGLFSSFFLSRCVSHLVRFHNFFKLCKYPLEFFICIQPLKNSFVFSASWIIISRF